MWPCPELKVEHPQLGNGFGDIHDFFGPQNQAVPSVINDTKLKLTNLVASLIPSKYCER